jgi:hypothetical protein
MRKSTVITQTDKSGPYEVEIFDTEQSKSLIICVHGNGVRRWDGEKFYYNVAEHYANHAVYLVDQNQPYEDGCSLNDIAVMVQRVQVLITQAKKDHPGIPLVVLAHSMGCGIAARLDTSDVDRIIFVAPTAGAEKAKLIKRYGPDIIDGKVVKTTDGLTKVITKEYYESVKDIVWEEEYQKLLKRFPAVYVFASGAEEIVGDERLVHEDMPFAAYTVIEGAPHNYAGESLERLYKQLDQLL